MLQDEISINKNKQIYFSLFFSIDIIICEIRLKYGYIARYCLPDSSPLRGYSPETSSRVTLASLGIGFQPNIPVGLARISQNDLPAEYRNDLPQNDPRPTTHNPQPTTPQ